MKAYDTRGRHKWTLQQNGAPYRTLCGTIAYLCRCAAWECLLHWLSRTCAPTTGFKSDGLRHLGTMRESTTTGTLTPMISWSRRACWSNAHCNGASLITTSGIGNVVYSVSCMRMAGTLNTRFTNCRYCKIIVVTDDVYEIFSAVGPTARLSLHC